MEKSSFKNMEKPMNDTNLNINASWETLDEGNPEECACFAALRIDWGETCLTECYDPFDERIRTSPLLSGYHLAEWLAWNWWRLRWEPRTPASDWPFSHNIATVGAGYVWPNITIFSDGQRIALIAKPTQDVLTKGFRYISNVAAIVGATQFEAVIDDFIDKNINQLQKKGIFDTNLHKVWRDVHNERSDTELSKRRKLEALFGVDPDEGDLSVIDQLISDSKFLGYEAIGEVAANYPRGGTLLTLDHIRDAANSGIGFDISLSSSVNLERRSQLIGAAEIPAWRLGARVARSLREQEGLRENPITDATLAELAGTQETIIKSVESCQDFSFILSEKENQSGRIVFRSKWDTGRRFELARLLGDRLMTVSDEVLFPATRAYTFRQKMQRSFAAEFLAPFKAVIEQLGGDYSAEKRHEVASYFNVSDLTIDTVLVNHRVLDRDSLFDDFDPMDNSQDLSAEDIENTL